MKASPMPSSLVVVQPLNQDFHPFAIQQLSVLLPILPPGCFVLFSCFGTAGVFGKVLFSTVTIFPTGCARETHALSKPSTWSQAKSTILQGTENSQLSFRLFIR